MNIFSFIPVKGRVLVRGAITPNLKGFQIELFQWDPNDERFALLEKHIELFEGKYKVVMAFLRFNPLTDVGVLKFKKLRKNFYSIPSNWVMATMVIRKGN